MIVMNEYNMQHGIDWHGQDITGYIAAEKYNGCRAIWDGKNLWSRGGLQINLPDSWRKALPAGVTLDGEIYDGIDGIYRCGAAIRYSRFTASMKFMVFDCPRAAGDYIARLKFASKFEAGPLEVVSYRTVSGLPMAKEFLSEVVLRGGEGLMLRDPALEYTVGRRTDKLLKFKPKEVLNEN